MIAPAAPPPQVQAQPPAPKGGGGKHDKPEGEGKPEGDKHKK